MSDPGNIANGNGGGGGGFGGNQLGGSPLPTPSGGGGGEPGPGEMAIPGLGNIKAGQTSYHTEHEYHKAVFNKLINAGRILGRMREEMDKLTAMGDTVSPEDVIAGAGRLVGHGVPPKELATILSDMPTQAGQGLAAWIAQNDLLVAQQEQHVHQMTEVSGHDMAVSGMRVLATHALQDHAKAAAGNAQGAAAQMGALAPRRGMAAAATSGLAPAQAPPGGAPPGAGGA